jgi:serpin B
MLTTRFARLFPLTLAAALLASSLAGCAPAAPSVAEARSDLPRQTAPNAPPADQAAVAAGNNLFAFDLYQALRADPELGNLFYSPYSLSSALAMAYAGARGDTEQQMALALHYSLPQDQLHPAFNALDLALTAPPTDEGAFTLRIANSLWGQADFTFLPAYLDTLAVNYGAGLRLVDFMQDATREQARQAINRWVAEQTEDKITELFKTGQLTQDTRLVLANAIYFKALWETPFAPESPQANFTLRSGEVVSVTTMGRRAATPYTEGDGYQAVALPYQGGRAEMLILVPAAGQLEAFEQTLTAQRLAEIALALEPQDVKLYLPRFSFASDLSLGETLAALGMPDAFDWQRADFSGMTGEPNLVLKHVVHQAVVAVDELGTEAAAATGITAEIVSMPTEVRADRPFVFVIWDRPSETVLFVGRVVEPR